MSRKNKRTNKKTFQETDTRTDFVESAGDTKSFCTEFLNSNPAGTVTSKNPLLVQSQKWHALAQSHEKSKVLGQCHYLEMSRWATNLRGENHRAGVDVLRKEGRLFLPAVPSYTFTLVMGMNIMIQQRDGRLPLCFC